MERKVSQAIEGQACAFADFTPDGAPGPSTLFTFSKRTPTESKVNFLHCCFLFFFSLKKLFFFFS